MDVTHGIQDAQWELFEVEGFTARAYPSVCALNEGQILIMGGHKRNALQSDVLTLETESMTLSMTKFIGGVFFKCDNMTYKAAQGAVISLITDG